MVSNILRLSGSLPGMIRQNGFIPGDDCMPRDDFEKNCSNSSKRIVFLVFLFLQMPGGGGS